MGKKGIIGLIIILGMIVIALGGFIVISGEHGLLHQGWFTDEQGKVYYLEDKKGTKATGWKYIDGKVYYFYQEGDRAGYETGEQAADYTTSGGIEIPKQGYIDGAEGKALAYGIDVLDRNGWELKEAYQYSSHLGFKGSHDAIYGYKIHNCALHGFEYGEGNCMAWAGTFCTMARLLGYDCRMIWGTLQWNENTVTHSWTEIWYEDEDEPHVFDPRHNDGQDLSGYDVRYGDKGTYKYNLESRQYLAW